MHPKLLNMRGGFDREELSKEGEAACTIFSASLAEDKFRNGMAGSSKCRPTDSEKVGGRC